MADKPVVFDPPMNSLVEKDSSIIRVPLDKTDFANRKSQQPSFDNSEMAVRHVPNGR